MASTTPYRATVLGLLLAMGIVMALSVRDDTLTTDEGLYIPTGYLYVTEHNARIGFEHPPLIRDLAVLPLLFLNLRPARTFFKTDIRGRLSEAAWDLGDAFIYEQPEPPDRILFLARLPMIGLALLLGFLIYRWTREVWGSPAGLIALALYVASPFALGHGRLVTMDVPSALGAWAAIFCFVRFLENPSRRNVVLFGTVFAGAQLVKFALLSMLPFLAGLLVLWTLLHRGAEDRWLAGTVRLALEFAAGLGVSVLVISLVYAFHIWNYPAEQHVQDMIDVLSAQRTTVYPQFAWLPALARWTVFRPLAHSLFGVVWQGYRYGAFGYFMGEGSPGGWLLFYPFGYFAKHPIAFHLLTLLALWQVARELTVGRGRGGSWYLVDTDCEWGQDAKRLAAWVAEHDIPSIKVADRLRIRLSHSVTPSEGWVYSRSYAYYLGRRYAELEPGVEEKGWIAVPARLLRWGQARPAARLGWSSDSYAWLAGREPITVIGNSIFVYEIR